MKAVSLMSLIITILLIVACTGCDKYCQASKKTLEVADFPPPCSSTAWVKKGIVLKQTEPYEKDFLQNFTSPAEPLDGGRWRIWYSAGSPMNIGVAEGIPGYELPPQKFDACRRISTFADKQLLVRVDTNRYSVPGEYGVILRPTASCKVL